MPDNAVVRSLFPSAGHSKKVAFNPDNFVIESVEQLLFAEEVLDAMDADLVDKIHYAVLHTKAEQYVKTHLDLLTKPWLRNGGAVHDIIEALRQETGASTPAVYPSHCH